MRRGSGLRGAACAGRPFASEGNRIRGSHGVPRIGFAPTAAG